jgi:hypothetical protein
MTTSEAIKHAYRLQAVWVGEADPGTCYDFERIKASIRSEMKFNRQRPERCTLACARETHGDAILLGKVSKVLTGLTAKA